MALTKSAPHRGAITLSWLIVIPVASAAAQSMDPAGPRPVEPRRHELISIRVDASHKAALDAMAPSARVDRDYGAFRWMLLDDREAARLRAAGIPFEFDPAPFSLVLGNRRFDPLGDASSGRTEPSPTGADGFELRLVQFEGPVRAEWLEEVRSDGSRIVSYVHPYAYVVWSPTPQFPAVQGQAMRWTGPFRSDYRLTPGSRQAGGRAIDIHVVVFRGADVNAIAERLENWSGAVVQRRILDDRFEVIGCSLPGSKLADAAGLQGVYSVQAVPQDGGARGEMSCQVNVNNVDGNDLAFPGYLTWLGISGLQGAGVVMANVDLGVQQSHPDLTGRVLACSGTTCGGAIQDDHGTHTAGLMVGMGATATLDAWGFRRGQGVAPSAKIVEQLYEPFFMDPGGLLLLMTESRRNGAVLSSNSWGSAATPQGYDNTAMQVDIGIRDADPDEPGPQPLGYVLAIENGFGLVSTQGAPDEAKNTIAVGASQFRSVNGSPNGLINRLSQVTAHGPALDGRRIPHVVAPGCYEDSTFTGSGHGLLCGTSMAAPQVAGSAALFVQKFRVEYPWHGDPSPALVKAAILPICHDLAGFADANGQVLGHRPDSRQGWGRLDLDALMHPPAPVDFFDQHMVFDDTGSEWSRVAWAIDPGEPMRVMLVWTDAPGHGLGGATPAWNNDLDLTVVAGPDTYRGNVIGPDGWSSTGGSADGMNNVEAVMFGPGGPASATIRVAAANLTSDGVPGIGDDTDQDFAIVCYNCEFPPAYSVSATPFEQSICVGTDAVFQIDVGAVHPMDESVALSVTGAPAGTTVDVVPDILPAPGMAGVTIGDTALAVAGLYALQIRGRAELDTVESSVALRVYADIPAAPAAGTPVDNAVNVSPLPALSWSMAGEAATYEWEVAADAGFSNIVANGVTVDPTVTLDSALDTDAVYYWRVRGVNSCGPGLHAPVRSFRTLVSPKILLVDDDDNSPDVRPLYASALDAVDYEYAVWDTGGGDDEPDVQELARYSAVIWFTGDAFGGSAGPGAAGESALAWFLNDGHCVFVSSQDYLRDRGVTPFATDFLGVAGFDEDVEQNALLGAGVLNGLGPYALSFSFDNASDGLAPTKAAGVSAQGDVDIAGVEMETGVYWSAFWSAPFEAIADVNDRVDVLRAMLDHCDVLLDCNDNTLHDPVEVAGAISPDCDGNLVPDGCDLAAGRADDCQPNGTLDSCDIAGGPSSDANKDGIPDECEAPCDFTPDCVLTDVCTAIRCIANLCTPFEHLYGDVNLDGVVDIFDILCVLDGFTGSFTQCAATETDFALCMRDGVTDIFDILAVLDAFGGVDDCCGGA